MPERLKVLLVTYGLPYPPNSSPHSRFQPDSTDFAPRGRISMQPNDARPRARALRKSGRATRFYAAEGPTRRSRLSSHTS